MAGNAAYSGFAQGISDGQQLTEAINKQWADYREKWVAPEVVAPVVSAACVHCGAPFKARESTCSYCTAARI